MCKIWHEEDIDNLTEKDIGKRFKLLSGTATFDIGTIVEVTGFDESGTVLTDTNNRDRWEYCYAFDIYEEIGGSDD